MPRLIFSTAFLMLCLAFNTTASAGISLSSTRLIINEGKKEQSLVVRNSGERILVQSWLEPEAGVNVNDLPFVVTPPLVRVAAEQQQLLRILYSGASMPADKESIFWLNVQEIPQVDDPQNALQFAIRQRIKVFYRPKNLAGEPIQAPLNLEWRLTRTGADAQLRVSNTTPYYVSLVELDLAGKSDKRITEAQMLAPGASEVLPLNALDGGAARTLHFGSINDYGGRDQYVVDLLDGQVTRATAKN